MSKYNLKKKNYIQALSLSLSKNPYQKLFPTREEEGRMGGKNKRTRNEKTSSLRIKIKWQNLRERGEASSNFLKLGFDSGAGIGGGPLEL